MNNRQLNERPSGEHGRRPLRRATLPALGLWSLLLWSLAATCGAVPQLESPYGGQSAYLLPEINAMGGTGVTLYRGGMSGLLNPAMLTAETGMRFDLSGRLDHQDEDRYQPLYDTFDSYVTDIVIASNRHDHHGTGFAFARRLVDGGVPLVASLSLADRYEFDYAFEEEIRDPDSGSTPRDQILENRSMVVDGTLRDLTLGLATDVLPGYSLGIAMNYAFGSRDETWSRRYYREPSDTLSYVRESNWDPSGVNFTVGARVRVDSRLELGAAYETPLSAEGDLSAGPDDAEPVTSEVTVRYPGEYRVGFALRPRNNPRTTVAGEVAYREWSKLEDSRADGVVDLEDVLDVRFGVEHTFTNAMRMMFGFRHYDSYLAREVGTSVFSGGVGTPVAGGGLVVSLELNKLTARDQAHIFPYPDGVDSYGNPVTGLPTARVEDMRLRLGIGWTRSF